MPLTKLSLLLRHVQQTDWMGGDLPVQDGRLQDFYHAWMDSLSEPQPPWGSHEASDWCNVFRTCTERCTSTKTWFPCHINLDRWQMIHMEYTFGPQIPHHHYHLTIIRTRLTRNLSVLLPGIKDEMVATLDGLLDMKPNGCSACRKHNTTC